ncbi:hypothetical protein Q7O_000521 [Pectobacterium carotovorum subsp. carotovorum PCCS1]|nr:hypothetical protein [Pectobacterium carotovorum subsp. carotovorum PCCS1]
MHFAIEKATVKVVAQVVMGGDIFLRLLWPITAAPVDKPMKWRYQPAKTRFKRIDQRLILRQKLENGREVRGAPVPINITFSSSDTSSQQYPAINAMMVYRDFALQGRVPIPE